MNTARPATAVAGAASTIPGANVLLAQHLCALPIQKLEREIAIGHGGATDFLSSREFANFFVLSFTTRSEPTSFSRRDAVAGLPVDCWKV